jgi:ComF family protein
MAVSRRRHGSKLGSLETMPEPVNLEAPAAVDGGARAAAWWARGWPRIARPGHAWLPWSPRCLGCGESCAGGRDLCVACDAALPRIRHACPTCGLPCRPASAREASSPCAARCRACRDSPPPLAHIVAPFLYAPPLDRWLPRFKFHRDMAAGRLLAQLMFEACAAAPRPDAVVPVPLHRKRLRARGYDQALELAKPLARALALPLRADLLRRTRATAAQSSLQAAERSRNLVDAFAIPPLRRDESLPSHIVLVDDVMTTGATLHAAARTLLAAGATRVDAWACARTP